VCIGPLTSEKDAKTGGRGGTQAERVRLQPARDMIQREEMKKKSAAQIKGGATQKGVVLGYLHRALGRGPGWLLREEQRGGMSKLTHSGAYQMPRQRKKVARQNKQLETKTQLGGSVWRSKRPIATLFGTEWRGQGIKKASVFRRGSD